MENSFCAQIKKQGKQADISQFRAQLDALGLKIIQVTADGNCFFRSVVVGWLYCKCYSLYVFLLFFSGHILLLLSVGCCIKYVLTIY